MVSLLTLTSSLFARAFTFCFIVGVTLRLIPAVSFSTRKKCPLRTNRANIKNYYFLLPCIPKCSAVLRAHWLMVVCEQNPRRVSQRHGNLARIAMQRD